MNFGAGDGSAGFARVSAWCEARKIEPAFAKRQRLLSPDQYEIVGVRTSRGVRRAMLFPKAILQAEFEANAPLGEAINPEHPFGVNLQLAFGPPLPVQHPRNTSIAVARSLIDLGTQTINSERPAHVAAVFLGVNLSTTLATQRIDQAAALGDILCKCESRLSSLLNAHGLALSVFKRAISFGFNLHRPG